MRQLIPLLLACAAVLGAQEPKGERLLGLGLTEGSAGYDATLAAGQAVGLQFTEIPQQWDEVEPTPGRFESPMLAIVDEHYPRLGLKVVIALNPIDTTSTRLPADLKDTAFDDPRLVARYLRAVDFVLGELPQVELVAFSVGNEVDAVLGEDPARWAAYTRFFRAAAKYVRSKRPGVPVGVKLTYGALTQPATRELARALNAHADAVFATYYPLDADARVRKPEAVPADLAGLLEGTDKPLYLLEAGYPSSADVGSSKARQTAFVRELFAAWDTHRARIPALNLVWVHDLTPEEVQAYSRYYGSEAKGFVAFLASLGLRSHTGKPKPAWGALERATRARGWGKR